MSPHGDIYLVGAEPLLLSLQNVGCALHSANSHEENDN